MNHSWLFDNFLPFWSNITRYKMSALSPVKINFKDLNLSISMKKLSGQKRGPCKHANDNTWPRWHKHERTQCLLLRTNGVSKCQSFRGQYRQTCHPWSKMYDCTHSTEGRKEKQRRREEVMFYTVNVLMNTCWTCSVIALLNWSAMFVLSRK